jgi:hypothetical protein
MKLQCCVQFYHWDYWTLLLWGQQKCCDCNSRALCSHDGSHFHPSADCSSGWSNLPYHKNIHKHWNVRFLIVSSLERGIFVASEIPQSYSLQFLPWGYQKSKVFSAPPPWNIPELRCRIQEAAQICVHMLHCVVNNVHCTLEECVQNSRGCLQNVICRTWKEITWG